MTTAQFRERPAALVSSIKVVLVDDQSLVREGLRRLLEEDPGIEVVGEASDCDEAIDLIVRLQPHVALLDIRLGRGSGIEVGRAIGRLAPSTRILVLSAYTDSHYVSSLVSMGVAGYLTKAASGDELKRAIHSIACGYRVFATELTDRVGSTPHGVATLLWSAPHAVAAPLGRSPDRPGGLTPRQSEVLEGMASGLSNRELADSLGISRRTVEAHVERILLKLGARSRTQAVLGALRDGWLGEV